VLALVGSASSIQADVSASATISSTQLTPNTWQYDVTLDDTGTTNVGTLWFSWLPGQDFMPSFPTNITSPASWSDLVTGGFPGDGSAIQWVAGPGAALPPGESLSGFLFDSTTSPTTMAGVSPLYPLQPVLTSVVYSGGPFSDAGFELRVQPVSPTPEPANGALVVVCAGILIAMRQIRRRRQAIRIS
jgi:hypothetical protein